MMILDIEDGRFILYDHDDGKTTFDSPEEVNSWLAKQGAGSVMCSSSIDFPEEEGMTHIEVDVALGSYF
tara:strand:- start:739 stop:945 length:207 start_codon:yes stop_codon:yes gene_type:complete